MSNRHYQEIKCSFNLPNGKSVFGNNIGCKGNGKTLGMTDGTQNGGTVTRNMAGESGTASILLNVNYYGGVIGQAFSNNDRTWGNAKVSCGLVSDTANSGVILDTSGSLNAVIKY